MGVGEVYQVWGGGQELSKCIFCTYCCYTNILVFRLNGISVDSTSATNAANIYKTVIIEINSNFF